MTQHDAQWEAINTMRREIDKLRVASHRYGNTLQEHEAYIQGAKDRRRERLPILLCAGSAVFSSFTTIAVAVLGHM